MSSGSSKKNKSLSQKQKNDLDLEIRFMEGILEQDPDFVEALQILADDYTRRGRIEDGLQADIRLAELCPDDPMVFYNLACSLSLMGQLEESAKALHWALDTGYNDIDWMEKDPDLENLRNHYLFKEIMKRLQGDSF